MPEDRHLHHHLDKVVQEFSYQRHIMIHLLLDLVQRIHLDLHGDGSLAAVAAAVEIPLVLLLKVVLVVVDEVSLMIFHIMLLMVFLELVVEEVEKISTTTVL